MPWIAAAWEAAGGADDGSTCPPTAAPFVTYFFAVAIGAAAPLYITYLIEARLRYGFVRALLGRGAAPSTARSMLWLSAYGALGAIVRSAVFLVALIHIVHLCVTVQAQAF